MLNHYALQSTIDRYRLAWRYARNRLTPDDALTMLCEAESLSGQYALESISASEVLDDAIGTYGEVEGLDDWVGEAVARVAHKWESTSDVYASARDWAFDLIKDYAERDGVTLEKRA